MTKSIFLFSIVMFSMTLHSCSFVHLFEVKSSNTKDSEGYFQIENDTLRIIYNFNSEGGGYVFSYIKQIKYSLVFRLEKIFIYTKQLQE